MIRVIAVFRGSISQCLNVYEDGFPMYGQLSSSLLATDSMFEDPEQALRNSGSEELI